MIQNTLYQDEFTLLQQFKAGDNSAFQTIYDHLYRPLYHYANRFVKDNEQAEDILAESFTILWQKREEFETFKGVTNFLYTIVRNACYDHLKKVKVRTKSIPEISYLSEIKELSERTEAIKTDIVHYSLIEGSRLPSQMKKIFELVYIEGFTATEIADKLDLSVHTVRVQKANAIKRVRESLAKKGLLSWLF